MKRKQKTEKYNVAANYTTAKVRHTSCCGLCELFNLEDGPVDCLAALAAWQHGLDGFDGDDAEFEVGHGNYKPLVVFSDWVDLYNGHRLARYIKKHRLGSLVYSRIAYNENSGNYVRAWLWTIHQTAWEDWMDTHIQFTDDTDGTEE